MLVSFPDFPLFLPFFFSPLLVFLFLFLGVFLFGALGSMRLYTCTDAVPWTMEREKKSRWLISYSAVFFFGEYHW
jgi:hypothetical protein